MTKSKKMKPADTHPPAADNTVSALAAIERLATNKDTQPAVLDRLMDAYEKERARADKLALHTALAAVKSDIAQMTFPKDTKVSYQTRNGGRKEYAFASLPDIKRKIDPVMAAAGLSYSYDETIVSGKTPAETIIRSVITIRGHGAEITTEKSTYLYQPGDSVMNPAQAAGAHSTYLHRYVLCGALGIAPDDDDNDNNTNAVKEGKTVAAAPATKDQYAALNNARKTVGKQRGFDAVKFATENPELNREWLKEAKAHAGVKSAAELTQLGPGVIEEAFAFAARQLKIGNEPKGAK